MVTQWIMTFFHGVASSLFTWAHNTLPSPPTWVADMTNAFNTCLGMVPNAVRYFVPLGPAVDAGLLFVTILVTAGAIRLGRRVLSIFTAGGGAA